MAAGNASDALAELSRAAAEFLGPIAGMLVQRLAGQAASFVELREAVALEIDNPAYRERFRQNTLALIRTGALPAPAPAGTAAPAGPDHGWWRSDPQLLQQLADELQPYLGQDAGRIVLEQAGASSNRVQLFLRLGKLVADPQQRRLLEARALNDYKNRLS